MSQVAYAVAAISSFARQLENPIACALRDLQKPIVPSNLEGFQISMSDQARPHDNWIILTVSTTAGNKVEMVTPAVVLESWNLVFIEPFKATCRLIQIWPVIRCAVEQKVSVGHVTAPFGGLLRMDAQERAEIYRGLTY